MYKQKENTVDKEKLYGWGDSYKQKGQWWLLSKKYIVVHENL